MWGHYINMTTGIYTITNLINNKMYVGLAVNIEDRWAQHISELKSNKHKSRHLQSAWKKHGETNFLFQVLVECEIEYLYSEEHYWATLLDVHNRKYGYNIKPTHPYGKPKHSEETKELIRSKKIGIKVGSRITEAGREKLRQSRLGKKTSQETIQKIREARKGIVINISAEVRQQMSIRAKNSRHTEETKNKIKEFNYKPLIVLNENSEFIEELPSCEKAIEKYGIGNTTLHRAISKKKTVQKEGTKTKFFFIDKKEYNPDTTYCWDSEKGKRGKSYKIILVKVINIENKQETIYSGYASVARKLKVNTSTIRKAAIKGYNVKGIYKIKNC
jgi:group I intron endonuclease